MLDITEQPNYSPRRTLSFLEKEEMADIEAIAKDVVDCAIKVHKALGPGLLESAYQYCHAYELRKRGRVVGAEIKLPLVYEDQKIDVGYRVDTLINGLVILEHKTVENFCPSMKRNC